MKTRLTKHLIRDGDLVAEVEIELSDDFGEWGSTMSADDAMKIDDIREAMKRRDYVAAAKLARIYRLTPIESGQLPSLNAA